MSSNSTPTRRIVIVADAVVQEQLRDEIDRLQFLAYSMTSCSGRGIRGSVENVFGENSHVRIEALGSLEAARRLLRYIEDQDLARFNLVCFMDLVEVIPQASVA